MVRKNLFRKEKGRKVTHHSKEKVQHIKTDTIIYNSEFISSVSAKH